MENIEPTISFINKGKPVTAMSLIVGTLNPMQSWERLSNYKSLYYDSMSAVYSGEHSALRDTADSKTFWNRNSGSGKIHVPIASDIAATSANLLFSKEPTYTIVRDGSDMNESEQQKRLEFLLYKNNIASKLIEGAETCAALGDVYIKIRWNTRIDYPIIDVVQPDQAWPEYVLGELTCVHFFTDLYTDYENDTFVRVYEKYTKGRIEMCLFKGSQKELGNKLDDSELVQLGYAPEISTPVDEMLAIHIANLRPNRRFRSSMLGRSDFDGLRNLFDALDETYSSWIRDIRLGKAKLIVPIDYLRRKPQSIIDGVAAKGAWEFDADVETYVAMDIDVDRAGGTGITPSQFEIRSTAHAQTCADILRNILQLSGYSPQSFGIDVTGSSSSGTALSIRERRSYATKNKKMLYWQTPLEQILTTAIRVDSVLYPYSGSISTDHVSVAFSDSMSADQSTIAATIEMLERAKSSSVLTRVRMQHPDWSEKQVSDEVEKIKDEYGMNIDSPDLLKGDFEGAGNPDNDQSDDEADNYGADE